MPQSSPAIAVHLPVPFWPATSRILVTSGAPSSSLKARMSRVISMRNESSSPLFHSAKTSAIAAWSIPRASFIRWYASQMSCMSPYSTPLCTIFTKCPEPPAPTQSQQGSSPDLAAIDWKIGRRVGHAAAAPPGMSDGP
eukprot:Amastigsp_a350122_9.p3 type:complete len:139 gc:universal Amastigsp_a350122_9:551-967(+)